MITEVCERMNHYIKGGVDDGDGGEDDVEGNEERRAAARGAPSPPPASWGALPLPSWLLGSPPPWTWDPWGRQKHGFGGWKFVVEKVLTELGFPPLYRLSDFRQPL